MVSDLEDISGFDEKYVIKIDGIISRHNCQVEKTSFPHFLTCFLGGICMIISSERRKQK